MAKPQIRVIIHLCTGDGDLISLTKLDYFPYFHLRPMSPGSAIHIESAQNKTRRSVKVSGKSLSLSTVFYGTMCTEPGIKKELKVRNSLHFTSLS